MIRHGGANMETVRKSNRATILKFINDNGPVSRKDLADVTGLTPAAVTQICTDLIQQGILVETGVNAPSKGAGRKKILLDIDYNIQYVFAINIESEETTVALSNLKGDCVAYKTCRTDASAKPEDFLRAVANMCHQLQEEHSATTQKIVAVGVCIPGLVDTESGSSKKAYGIWNDEVAVKNILEQYLPYGIYVENNVNALATAELYFGIGKEYDHLMLIKWGPGVGCSMVIDQQIYEGRHSKAAELGHFIVDPKGERCSCGRRGCLETKISYQALQKIKPFAEEEFGGVYVAAKEKQQAGAFDEAIDMFARSIVNSATIMAPNRIVMTGPLFKSEEIRDALVAACAAYDPVWGQERIVYSELSKEEDYIGPVAICAKQILFS